MGALRIKNTYNITLLMQLMLILPFAIRLDDQAKALIRSSPPRVLALPSRMCAAENRACLAHAKVDDCAAVLFKKQKLQQFKLG
jgi:hypothetical protein